MQVDRPLSILASNELLYLQFKPLLYTGVRELSCSEEEIDQYPHHIHHQGKSLPKEASRSIRSVVACKFQQQLTDAPL